MLSCFSCVWLFVTPWTVACQALLFMRFSMQEHWSGLLCPPSGDLPYPGIQPASLTSPALAGRFFTTSATWEAPECSLAGTKSDKWKVEHLEDGFTDHDEVPQTFPSQQICPSLIKKKKVCQTSCLFSLESNGEIIPKSFLLSVFLCGIFEDISISFSLDWFFSLRLGCHFNSLHLLRQSQRSVHLH